MIRFGLRLDPAFHATLEHLAKQERRSLHNLIVLLLVEALEARKK